MKSILTGCEEASWPGFPGPGGSGEGPRLLRWPVFKSLGVWGHYLVNTCSSLSFVVSGQLRVKFVSHKAIYPQIASCFLSSPDGYYIRLCFRVRIFIFVHCLDMILSNTSFIYTFAWFWPFWMKNKVLAWEKKISEDVAPGLTGSASTGRMRVSACISSSLCLFLTCANQTWCQLWGLKLCLLASSVLMFDGNPWVQAGSHRPGSEGASNAGRSGSFQVESCGRRIVLRVMLTLQCVHVRHKWGI